MVGWMDEYSLAQATFTQQKIWAKIESSILVCDPNFTMYVNEFA